MIKKDSLFQLLYYISGSSACGLVAKKRLVGTKLWLEHTQKNNIKTYYTVCEVYNERNVSPISAENLRELRMYVFAFHVGRVVLNHVSYNKSYNKSYKTRAITRTTNHTTSC